MAYTRNIDIADPADSDEARYGAKEIRESKIDWKERIESFFADVDADPLVPISPFIEESLFDANTILMATEDDTPVALEVAEQTVVGRITDGNIVALAPAQLQTLLLSTALPENVSIQFDAALSEDGKYSGFTWEGTAGAALAFGDCVYLAVADDRWELAKADAEATTKCKIGICVLAAGSNGDPTRVLYFGVVRADTAFPTFTKHAPVFLSAATAGDLTSTAPAKSTGHCLRIIGRAETGDILFVNPESGWDEYV